MTCFHNPDLRVGKESTGLRKVERTWCLLRLILVTRDLPQCNCLDIELETRALSDGSTTKMGLLGPNWWFQVHEALLPSASWCRMYIHFWGSSNWSIQSTPEQLRRNIYHLTRSYLAQAQPEKLIQFYRLKYP